MHIRTYHARDKGQLSNIFDSNCPKYFAEKDKASFLDFLDSYADENFLVVEEDTMVIGCGGHYTKEKRRGIAWTMFLRYALGPHRVLTVADMLYREMERRMFQEGTNYDLYISTSQHMEKLFGRYGFRTYKRVRDGLGLGLDECKMMKKWNDG